MNTIEDELVDGVLEHVWQVEALPTTAVIETRGQYVLERLSDGWYRPGVEMPYKNVYETWLPAKLLRYQERVVPLRENIRLNGETRG